MVRWLQILFFFVIICLIVVLFYSGFLTILSPEKIAEQVSRGSHIVPKKVIYYFKNLKGPTTVTTILVPEPTSYQKYSQGSESRLAVLLTDTNSNWLPLANGLKSIGIPFIITQDYRQALNHKVVLVYPYLESNILPNEAMRALADFPLRGCFSILNLQQRQILLNQKNKK
jgi:hypothetical protein